MTSPTRIPEATLREEWSATYVAWAGSLRPTVAGHRRSAPAARIDGAPGPAAEAPSRGARRAEALLRLASDPRATPHERALAAQKAAELLVQG